jgi:hypothetical protein
MPRYIERYRIDLKLESRLVAVNGMRARKSGSHQTPRWREVDSNPRSPVSEGSGLADKMIVDFDLDKLRSTDPPRG